jgi:hypothetical protein
MKTLVVYDSFFGNSEQLAVAMARGLAVYGPSRSAHVNETPFTQLRDVDLLILGCPTQSWNLTPDMKVWLERAPREMLRGPRIACYDTRARLPVFIGRHAAPLIGRYLRQRGVQLLAPPQGFWIKDRERRLEAGECERALTWAVSLAESIVRPRPAPPEPAAAENLPAE